MFSVSGSVFGVWGLGFGVWDLGFGVSGFGVLGVGCGFLGSAAPRVRGHEHYGCFAACEQRLDTFKDLKHCYVNVRARISPRLSDMCRIRPKAVCGVLAPSVLILEVPQRKSMGMSFGYIK